LTLYVNQDYHPVRLMVRRGLENRIVRTSAGMLAAVGLVCAVIAVPAMATGPHPKRKDEYKHQVEHLEEVWRTAQLNDDVDAMDKLLSDDYVGITMTGQVVTKMQQLDRMKNRTMVLNKIELDDVKVKLYGSTAIVMSRAQVDGTNDGMPMHGTYRYTRVYSRLPAGTWKITNFEATRVGLPGQQFGGNAQAQGEPQGPSPATQKPE
jgi:ketosteroid isomerase-like protein